MESEVEVVRLVNWQVTGVQPEVTSDSKAAFGRGQKGTFPVSALQQRAVEVGVQMCA